MPNLSCSLPFVPDVKQGSGKTTLLEHILQSPEHGVRIAVIVNDMSKYVLSHIHRTPYITEQGLAVNNLCSDRLNIDAALITNHKVSQTKEKLIQLQNGCICCTLRGDLLSELAHLTKQREVDYVVIESTGISEPMQVAETFTAEFSSAMLEADREVTQEDEESKRILSDMYIAISLRFQQACRRLLTQAVSTLEASTTSPDSIRLLL